MSRVASSRQRVTASGPHAEKPAPAVVNITFTGRTVDALGRAAREEGTGSGFIIDKNGDIVTNQHVVDAATRLDVTLADGSSYVGQVVASDPATDLAIVKLQAPADKLQQLTQDLLSLARLEARGIEPKDHPVDLCAVAREAVDAQGPTAAARKVRVELRAGASAPVKPCGPWEPKGSRSRPWECRGDGSGTSPLCRGMRCTWTCMRDCPAAFPTLTPML